MIVKLLLALVILIALVRLLMPRRRTVDRSARRAPDRTVDRRDAPPPPRVPRADDLVRCAGCGIWLPTGQSCDCEARA